jgi:hypothetical protein
MRRPIGSMKPAKTFQRCLVDEAKGRRSVAICSFFGCALAGRYRRPSCLTHYRREDGLEGVAHRAKIDPRRCRCLDAFDVAMPPDQIIGDRYGQAGARASNNARK